MSGSDPGPGHRDALFVAAGRYQDPMFAALRSPSRDAAELAEVLADPAIGGFGTRVLLDEPGHVLLEEIDGFFADRRAEDVLVLYLSCHGVKDVAGRLHFAVSTTKFSRLASTAISASFVYEQIDRCRAGKVVLLLDCCYSGAYAKGHRARAGGRAELKRFGGRGRAVITSCTAFEYAFEVGTEKVAGTAGPSVFTSALVGGLRTGRADRDGDGQVSIDELYDYVFDRVREVTPHQTPEKMWGDIRGDFIIAANPRPPARPALANAQGASDARQPARRALLGLTAAIAAGLAITGWDLAQPKGTHNPKSRATPTPTPLWTFSVPNALPPGPFIELISGIIFTVGDGQLYAVRASDGKKLWASRHFRMPTPSGYHNVVYIAGPYVVYALRADNGSRIWEAPIRQAYAPVVSGEVIFVAGEYGSVYALRASDGERLWSFDSAEGELSGVAASGGVVYIAGVNDGASIYALRDGVPIWRLPFGTVDLGPEVAGDNVYVITSSDTAAQLHALQTSDGAKLWTSAIDVSFSALPVIAAGHLYITGSDGALNALDLRTGKRLWSFLKSPEGLTPGPLLANEVIYFSDGREVHALQARDGVEIWTFRASNGIRAIALASGTICVASNDLYGLRASDGAKIWSYPVEANEINAMGDTLLVAASTGEIHALRI